MYKNKKLLTTKSGFTLVELLVAIAIIGILAIIIIVNLNNARTRARDARRIADLDSLRTALEMYYEDHKFYPSDVDPTGSTDCDCTDVGHYIGSNLVAGMSDTDCLSGCTEFLKYINPVPLDPLLGQRNPKANNRWFSYIYWGKKQGCSECSWGQSYLILATTERPHPNEGYKWAPWADDNFGDYYYAVAGGG